MIAFLTLGLALAGPLDGLTDNPKNQCSAGDAFPIAGTAGFGNALSALRTNAATYSAANFAEKHALRQMALSDEVEQGVFLAEANINVGVTRVPVFQEDATYGECPAAYVLGTRPIDMYAYNVGLAYKKGRVGLFYASSVTMGFPGELAYVRAYQTVGAVALGPAMTAAVPLTGSWQTSLGASAYAQDFVGGVIVDAGLGDLRAGYTQSRGWYLSGNDRYLGLFGTVVLRDGLSLVGQLRGGLERARIPDELADKVGRPSLFARVLPLTEPILVRDANGRTSDGREQIDLFTGHVEQEGIGGVLDLRAAYAVRPVPQLHQAAIALHDRGWYAAEDGEVGEASAHFYVEAGFLTLPPQYYYGLDGGDLLHLRAEYQVVAPAKEGAVPVAGTIAVLFNDPEQTALYPFAVNKVSIRLQLRGGFQ